MCRPEGHRCVVVAAGGSTVGRLRNGVQLHRFQSSLPGGSGSTAGGGSDAFTIFDAVFQPDTNTYYIMDLMCWKVRLTTYRQYSILWKQAPSVQRVDVVLRTT